MHELSILNNIIAIAENEVQKARANRVLGIELDIGQFSGIEMQCLEFAWQVAVPESVLRYASRTINRMPGKGKCMRCNKVSPLEQLFDTCPECHGYLDVIEGTELKVRSLTLN